jgi:hypothetical protein
MNHKRTAAERDDLKQAQTGNLISLYPKPTMDADGSSKIAEKST